MAYHPLNLAARFVLELAALVAWGVWGWTVTESPLRFLLVAAVPVTAAAVWGTFAVRGDRSRNGEAPVAVPGPVRLVVELAVLGGGAVALYFAGLPVPAGVLGALVLVHYALSYDRVAWLLGRA